MSMQRSTRREEGFTLIEMLITMIILVAVMGATVSFFRSQNQSFLDASRRLDALQNARFAISQVERELRTLGAGSLRPSLEGGSVLPSLGRKSFCSELNFSSRCGNSPPLARHQTQRTRSGM